MQDSITTFQQTGNVVEQMLLKFSVRIEVGGWGGPGRPISNEGPPQLGLNKLGSP